MKKKREKFGWSFKRFLIRIFLPFLFVALVAVGMRIYLTKEFNERHVRKVDQNAVQEMSPKTSERVDEDRSRDFSEENRTTAVAGLRSAKSVIDDSLSKRVESGSLDSQRVEEARTLKANLEESIEKLDTVEKDEWEDVRSRAYRQLDEYGEAVGKLGELS